MEKSSSNVGPRCFMVSVIMVVMLLFTGHLQLTEAQTACNPVEISWCLQAIVSNLPPSANCCRKLKGQEPCLCRETADPTFGGYLGLPGAKKVAAACGVKFPNCK